jgi:hypothetical protein
MHWGRFLVHFYLSEDGFIDESGASTQDNGVGDEL